MNANVKMVGGGVGRVVGSKWVGQLGMCHVSLCELCELLKLSRSL